MFKELVVINFRFFKPLKTRAGFLKEIRVLDSLKPILHLANLKKVGTLTTCSRRTFSPANFNQSRCRILVFASIRVNEQSRQVENRL